MATTNHERVGKALELLNKGLRPFVERELRAVRGTHGLVEPEEGLRDVYGLLKFMWDQWNLIFGKVLGYAERSLVSELREVRNRWAHQDTFSTDDAYRALDSCHRLLAAVSAKEAQEVEKQKQELLRIRFEEQARWETRRMALAPVEGQPLAGLKPWREIVTPHPDVASGRYQQAEFAADLGQVHRGEGSDEYRKPHDFFQRTFITQGLKHLLVGAIKRLSGTGGDPVVELQTNFGGGKTHSMLALYHLFSGVPMTDLSGMETVLKEADNERPPKAKRAVLVGMALSPGQPDRKPDGTVVRTLWGELAWQLGEKEGYKLVAEADARGVSPGSEVLNRLFSKHSPCLILIDEWIAFVRMTYGVVDLPGGSFDANLSFAQALTEAAKQVPKTLVVAAIPTSDIEIGGEGGREAFARLQNIFGRLEAVWRPATAEEGFEIVRRRLFQPISSPELFKARDAVARAFGDLYRNQSQEFPQECREADYERRIQAAYPIHPELFDRLYGEWSTLDRFQRTRGVLRLMASVIHALWEREDRSLLILPASIPIDSPAVCNELTRFLEDNWRPVIERDVDGPSSLPLGVDREVPNLGRYSACRRVARAIYIGSAPTFRNPNRGIEDRQIKLGCVQPGEAVATFGDALRRLSGLSHHLFVDRSRYWYSTQVSVSRRAEGLAEKLGLDAVDEEIRQRLRREKRGEFAGLIVAPASAADVADEMETRLVILGPEICHGGRMQDSSARRTAVTILAQRGNAPRLYRNTLVFLTADRARLDELHQAIRLFLAWRSIEEERESLNLDAFQEAQVRTKRQQADDTVQSRIGETYKWLLVPGQSDPSAPVEWQEITVQGQDDLATRAYKKLKTNELLIPQWAAPLLRRELGRIPLWRGNHVELRQLAEDFAKYLYLPRLRDPDVLLGAVRSGLSLLTWRQDSFAYANAWDQEAGRYLGLKAGQAAAVSLEGKAVLVKAEVAETQLDREKVTQAPSGGTYSTPAGTGGAGRVGNVETGQTAAPPAVSPKRFHGTVPIDPTRLGRDAGRIGDEVIAYLLGLVGARVNVTLEIEADVPSGVPEKVVRIITENGRTLKFTSQGFEEE